MQFKKKVRQQEFYRRYVVRVNQEHYERITQIAQMEECTLSEATNQLLQAGIEQYEHNHEDEMPEPRLPRLPHT